MFKINLSNLDLSCLKRKKKKFKDGQAYTLMILLLDYHAWGPTFNPQHHDGWVSGRAEIAGISERDPRSSEEGLLQ